MFVQDLFDTEECKLQHVSSPTSVKWLSFEKRTSSNSLPILYFTNTTIFAQPSMYTFNRCQNGVTSLISKPSVDKSDEVRSRFPFLRRYFRLTSGIAQLATLC